MVDILSPQYPHRVPLDHPSRKSLLVCMLEISSMCGAISWSVVSIHSPLPFDDYGQAKTIGDTTCPRQSLLLCELNMNFQVEIQMCKGEYERQKAFNASIVLNVVLFICRVLGQQIPPRKICL